jgi:hypothetical protein
MAICQAWAAAAVIAVRRDTVLKDLQMISSRVRARAAAAQHPGQRLVGVIAVPERGVMAEPFVIGLGEFLV